MRRYLWLMRRTMLLLLAFSLLACDPDPGSTSSGGAGGSGASGGAGGGGSSTGGASTGGGGAGTGGGTGGGTTHTTCDSLKADFEAETLAIRSCTTDAECGQVLQGTSCGCTRDWVARLDADTTTFYALIGEAGPLDCDLGLFSTCDCPGADGFVCDPSGICQWNYGP